MDVLTERFGPCDDSIQREIEAVSDAGELRNLAKRAIKADSLAELRRVWKASVMNP